MKKRLYAAMFVLLPYLGSCSQEAGNVEVVVSSSVFPLIPAPAVSCMSEKNAGSDIPSADVAPSYFRIPKITFNRKDTTKDLIIAFIRVSIPVPGSDTVTCELGGDGLAALTSTWYATTSKDALIPAGDQYQSFSTDCAMKCGGIEVGPGVTATGTMEVFGLERDSNGDELPVRASTSVSIQSF